MVKKEQDPEEVNPEVERRLAAIRARDLEKLTEEQMNRCLHVKGVINLGPLPISFYFNPLTTIVSAVIIWGFVIWCIRDDDALKHLTEVKTWVTEKWTWLYVGTQDVWALFIIALYFSKYSNMKLGKEDEKPEFSDGTYFTMLFSCGIAIGLFYYGVAEPIFHYQPGGLRNRYWKRYNDNQRAQDAINLTFFHWGIHGWIVYVIIGLLLSFLAYRRGLPMTMRTCFYPILGDKIFGLLGDLIDILCIICTMFGVCTSLGLGVMQLINGIHRIDPSIPENTDSYIVAIWCITGLATLSVISGIKLGIRRLSETCFGIGCLIMFIILYADNTWHILNLFVQSTGYYMQWIIQLGFHTDAFAQLGNAPDGKENPDWIDGWTIFYWGWWISWSPFVGMFIAKISRGRTIKDFIIYTLTLPCFYSFFWMSIFGGVGIQMENTADNLNITCDMYKAALPNNSVYKNQQERIFAMYGTTKLSCRGDTEMWFDVMNSYGDIGDFLSVFSLIAIIMYFVTSSDSGSLVIDCLSANGNPDPPIFQRIFWAFTEGATATALLVAGGTDSLKALQTVSVACGLPFTFCLNWTCVAMWRAVREEAGEIDETDGRWSVSLWDLNNVERLSKTLISIFCPWLLIAKTRMILDNVSDITHQVIYSLTYAIPFYLWIFLMLLEMQYKGSAYVGWASLMFFFAFAGGVRGEVRDRYELEGDMVEDAFSFVLVYPLACMQIHEQVTYGQRPEDARVNAIEMGQVANGDHVPSYDNPAVVGVSHTEKPPLN
ncbi:glycine betaine transporter 1-like [Hydractinia symbiolongicarpus]|uniref:glycine betaine transporter 1-like n=1 Tax=Hydractinia symbiolongicarpus TaxID=13093 RepID=UPI00254A8DA0|nr:glycine betaine transporter 1-like [Hydractinia symbiolongicarpus]